MNINIQIHQIQVLDAIDRLGSFAAAADELHRAKSAITYSIKQLEASLDIVIFDRSGHKAKLTSAGQLLLTDGRKLLADAKMLAERVRSLNSGWQSQLRIAYDETINFDALKSLIGRFQQSSPNTQLYLSAETLGGCWDALLHNRTDLAIGASGLMPDRDNFTLQQMGSLVFDFVVGKDHPLAECENLALHDINQYPAVYLMDSARRLPEQNYDVQAATRYMYVSSIREKIDLIASGLGVGFLPRHMATAAVKKGLVLIKAVDEPRPSVTMFVAYPSNCSSNKALQWWLQQMRSKPFKDRWFSQP